MLGWQSRAGEGLFKPGAAGAKGVTRDFQEQLLPGL